MGVCIPFAEGQLCGGDEVRTGGRPKCCSSNVGSIPTTSTEFVLDDICGGCGQPLGKCRCSLNAVMTCNSSSVKAEMLDSQDWFWKPEWQQMEHLVDADISAGQVSTYDTMDEFLDDLDIGLGE